MKPDRKIHFVASQIDAAGAAMHALQARYGQYEMGEADVIVALGGDGFMLRTLHRFLPEGLPVYGMKLGNVGFLMNRFREDELHDRLNDADVVGKHMYLTQYGPINPSSDDKRLWHCSWTTDSKGEPTASNSNVDGLKQVSAECEPATARKSSGLYGITINQG